MWRLTGCYQQAINHSHICVFKDWITHSCSPLVCVVACLSVHVSARELAHMVVTAWWSHPDSQCCCKKVELPPSSSPSCKHCVSIVSCPLPAGPSPCWEPCGGNRFALNFWFSSTFKDLVLTIRCKQCRIHVGWTQPFKSLGSPRQFCVFHENSLLFIKWIAKRIENIVKRLTRLDVTRKSISFWKCVGMLTF